MAVVDGRQEGDVEGTAAQTPSRSRARWPYALPLTVLIIGLLVTAALAVTSLVLNDNNEKRLLNLRAKEVGSVLAGALSSIQITLAGAAEQADATNGDVAKFRVFVGQYVGPPPGHSFRSMALWRAGSAAPITVVGTRPVLLSMPQAQSFITGAVHKKAISVIGLLSAAPFSLGYAYAPARPSPATRGLVVYAENPLPKSRRSAIASNSAFSDLDYAIYLGRDQRVSELLVTSVRQLPFTRRTAASVVPFGDTALTIAVAARRPLGGTLPQRLPWIIGIVGTVLSLGAAALTLVLIRRRRRAERLAQRLDRIASENRRLYAEQRNIAQTLQHALLPDAMPGIPGAEASARYQAGERGVEIGGDWYDLIALDDRRVLLVVGDVSGHGLRAAATMASLRYAIHAYAIEGDPPAEILSKLSRLINVASDGQIATVLCMAVDVPGSRITMASAGHLPPLLISDGEGQYVRGETGLPVGVDRTATYTAVTASAPPGATLLAFTDGLVERRGEDLDQGLERLCNAARANHAGLEELLQRLVSEVRSDPAEDDTAIVGLRWLS